LLLKGKQWLCTVAVDKSVEEVRKSGWITVKTVALSDWLKNKQACKSLIFNGVGMVLTTKVFLIKALDILCE